MNNLLQKICQKKRDELEITKNKCSLLSLKKLLPEKKNRKFKKLLQVSQKNKKNNIIAEIKKTSPSAGEILKNYVPEDIAVQYEKSGAGAISILTESSFFNGHIDHLSVINKKTSIFKENCCCIYKYIVISIQVNYKAVKECCNEANNICYNNLLN